MPKSCVVPNCKFVYCETSKRSVFRVPKDANRYKQWVTAIPGIVTLKPTHVVCDKHFKEEDIIREWIKRDSNGRIIAQEPYKYPQLSKFAVPSKFDDFSTAKDCAIPSTEYFSHLAPNKVTIDDVVNSVGKSSVEESVQIAHDSIDSSMESAASSSVTRQWSISGESAGFMNDSVQLIGSSIKESSAETTTSCSFVLPIVDGAELISPMELTDTDPLITGPVALEEPIDIYTSVTTRKYVENESGRTYQEICSKLPEYWSVSKAPATNGKIIIFTYMITPVKNGKRLPVSQKCVILDSDRKLQFYVYGRDVDSQKANLDESLEGIETLPNVLNKFKDMNVCSGLGEVNINLLRADTVFQDGIQQWRSKDCSLLFKKRRCDSCMKMRKRIQGIITRNKNRKKNEIFLRNIGASNSIERRNLVALRLKCRRQKCQQNRAKEREKHLMSCLKKQEEQIANMQEATLDEKCSALNVPAAQQLALKEIVAAASKKNTKGRRYREDWMMLCMLMNIRSPGYYQFLRKNNILPLPCLKSVRRYFSLIDMKCGFDERFAELLKKHLATKTPLQRHGVLLLDEINLRKSVAVCSKNLTYVGLTDLGDDGLRSSDISEQATHGLVVMFQSLADTYTQPIAVFASKNPVKGEELAKLVVKGIIYLERCGATIHGVIADGAATNQKMWSLLDVRGTMQDTKTWFTHPLDDERKVFVFSDTPHVIKNIRNRLLNQKKLRLNSTENYIRWQYFETLYELDKNHPGNARACPKITERHVHMDNASKMRVRLATQIFSNSVAQGLTFYLSHNCKALAGCEATIAFCKQVNDMFDALNRKLPNQGLTPECNDFKVLEDSLQWLNNWETAMVKKEIKPNEFLTTTTSRGLRITLQSTLHMCRYLIEKFNFDYLLTGKVNQDNLEKFFGTIRQAAGCNDHPNCPTFLQLYKLLSVYSVIKPPKFSNCTVSEDRLPSNLIKISDLKAVFGEKGEAKSSMYLREIQKKLDTVLEYEDWEADDLIEDNDLITAHDYDLSPILDCIIYYVTGF